MTAGADWVRMACARYSVRPYSKPSTQERPHPEFPPRAAGKQMFDNMFWYLLVCLAFFGIGDLLGVATKAKLSAVFVSLMLFLFAFMSGLIPPDIIKKAGLDQIAKWAVLFLIFSMGTTINMRELIAEWRTVVTACIAMGVVMLCAFLMIPLIGYQETIVSVPIVTGGIVATQIMTSAAMDQGFTLAAALGTIVFAVQKFLGTPIASYFGLREAREVVARYRETGEIPNFGGAAALQSSSGSPNFFERHKKYYGSFTCLAITAFFAWFAFMLGKWTGLSGTIWALILGAAVGSTGVLPSNILKHANCAGVFNCAVFGAIIPSLARIRPEDLLTLSYSIAVIFAIVIAALIVFFYVLPFWKVLGSRNVAVGVAVCQLLGFPATYLIVNEIISAVAENETEKKIISDRLMSKYLVAGFATVTTFSIIIAGFFVKFL